MKVLILFTLIFTTSYSQMKVGKNSKIIAPNVQFQIESDQGQQVVVTKDSGKMGIGTLVPSHSLHVSAFSNPLRIEGVQSGSLNIDSLIVLDSNGIIKRIAQNRLMNFFYKEPWYSATTSLGATSNSENIYQMGRVGINIVNPQSQFHIGVRNTVTSNDTYNGTIHEGFGINTYITSNNTNGALFSRVADLVVGSPGSATAGASTMRFLTSNNTEAQTGIVSEKMRIHTNGNIGIGTSAPTGALTLNGGAKSGLTATIQGISWGTSSELVFARGGATRGIAAIAAVDNGSFGGGLAFFTKPGNLLDNFPSGVLQPMVIDWNGRVGINTHSPTAVLSVNGVANNTSGTWAVFSDIRSKENIKPYQRGLNEVLNLNPITFNYNDSSSLEKSMHIGFIAQEVQKILPEMVVNIGKIGQIDNFLQITQEGFIQMLVNAIKEQHLLISNQKNEISILFEKYTNLERKIVEIQSLENSINKKR